MRSEQGDGNIARVYTSCLRHSEEDMRTCRNEAGAGQSYAHCCWGGPNPRHVNQTDGVHLLLLLVTMLDDKTAAVMRSDEGLRMDNCFLWHIARMLANLSNLCARFMWARTVCFCKNGFCQRLIQ